MDQLLNENCNPNQMKPLENYQQKLKSTYKSNNRQKILSPKQQVFIPSIINNTFSSDIIIPSLNRQNELRRNLRLQLVDKYLILNANQYVFFTAFCYLQNYLNKIQGKTINTNLLVITCLALSRKYQKGKSPDFKLWQQKLETTLNKQQIKQKEDELIQTLQFQLQPNTRYNFMSDLFLIIDLSQKVQHFCSYLLDLSVFLTHLELKPGQPSLQFTQAEIGLSVVRLACYFFNNQQLLKVPIQKFGYDLQRIHECCSSLFQLLMNKKMNGVKQIRHRYKRTKFMEVSKIQFIKLPKTKKQKANQKQNQEQETS